MRNGMEGKWGCRRRHTSHIFRIKRDWSPCGYKECERTSTGFNIEHRRSCSENLPRLTATPVCSKDAHAWRTCNLPQAVNTCEFGKELSNSLKEHSVRRLLWNHLLLTKFYERERTVSNKIFYNRYVQWLPHGTILSSRLTWHSTFVFVTLMSLHVKSNAWK